MFPQENKKAKADFGSPLPPPNPPQSIKAALLSKSLGPKGNQTQQLQLCLPRPVPRPPGLLPVGPRWLSDLAMNLPLASNRHKSISSAQQQAPPSPAYPTHGTEVVCAELHTCLVLPPVTIAGAAGAKWKDKFVLNIQDSCSLGWLPA